MNGVLFVGNFLSGAHAHRHYCEDLTDHLADRDWNIVRTSDRTARFARLLDMMHVTWHRRRDYALAHVDVFSGPAFLWAEAVCFELARLDKPFVLTLHGGNLPIFAKRWPGRVRRLLAAAARVTSPSEYLARQLAHLAPPIEIVPNGLDVAHHPFRRRDGARPNLVWVRAFHTVYNPTLAVDALGDLLRDRPDTRLTMIGVDRDGSLQQVRDRAASLGVAHALELIPGVPKDQVPQYLDRGDIFLNTTDVDNAPLSVVEAMACGLCVITTNVGGIPDLVEHERDALLVPPRSPAAMADAVRRVLDDPDLAAKLSASARATSEDRDWARVVRRWDLLFHEVARG